MVAGYIIDGVVLLHARWRGGGAGGKRGAGERSSLLENKENPHNFVLCHRLSSRVKWAFWWSNAPYWIICAMVAKQSWDYSAAVPWHECLR
jgi:hypothetical protein